MGGVSVPVVVGPTAVGKTAVAIALAAHLPVEVISADSRQIYRRLDIGTAKPTRRERARVPHHGLDVVEPGIRYSAGQFARDSARWVEEIRNRGRLPLVVGGTGLYIRALAEGLFHEPHLEPARRRSRRHSRCFNIKKGRAAVDRLDLGLGADKLFRPCGRSLVRRGPFFF